MKILFTADWHLKIKDSIPVEWQINRYKLLFDNIISVASKNYIDYLVIGGDIFDNIPTLEEISLYFEFIAKLRNKDFLTIIFDGNHEATKVGETFLWKLGSSTFNICNTVIIINPETEASYYDFDIIPYYKLKTFNPSNYRNDLLFTHVRGNIPPYVKSEIPLEKFKRWKTVLAGDLHSYTNSQENILYPGSPLTVNFHKNPVNTGVILFDTEDHSHKWIKLNLPQLLKIRISNIEEIYNDLINHVVFILETKVPLNTKTKPANVEIKIKKNTVSKMNFNKLSFEDEVRFYLRNQLNISNIEQIENIMGVFHDKIKIS